MTNITMLQTAQKEVERGHIVTVDTAARYASHADVQPLAETVQSAVELIILSATRPKETACANRNSTP